jgi:hypothetical protein
MIFWGPLDWSAQATEVNSEQCAGSEFLRVLPDAAAGAIHFSCVVWRLVSTINVQLFVNVKRRVSYQHGLTEVHEGLSAFVLG